MALLGAEGQWIKGPFIALSLFQRDGAWCAKERRHEWSISHEILYSSIKTLDRYWDCVIYRMRDLVQS
jgi:hypothetical protein